MQKDLDNFARLSPRVAVGVLRFSCHWDDRRIWGGRVGLKCSILGFWELDLRLVIVPTYPGFVSSRRSRLIGSWFARIK